MQSGKIIVTLVGNGASSAVAKWADTIYYEVNGTGDYVQETN